MYDAELIRTALKFPPGRAVTRLGRKATVVDVQRGFRKDYVKASLGGAFTVGFPTITNRPYFVAVRFDGGPVDGCKPEALVVEGDPNPTAVARVANEAFPIGTRVRRAGLSVAGVVVETRRLAHYDYDTFSSFGGCYARHHIRTPARIAVLLDSGRVQAWRVDQVEYAPVQPTVAVPAARAGYGYAEGYAAGRRDGRDVAEVRVESARRTARQEGYDEGVEAERARLRGKLGL